jgi:drug/metabolite transporter (DMT)-like permease
LVESLPDAQARLENPFVTPPAQSRGPASASLLAVLAMVGWGITDVPSAWLVESWPPLLAAAARIGVGGVILLGALILLRQPVLPGAEWRVVLVLAITQSFIFYGATFIGIAAEGAGVAAVLANTDPLFVAALAAGFLGERLNGRQWSGLVVGLVGAAAVVWQGPLWPPSISLISLLVVVGALGWAVGTVAVTGRIRAGARPVAIAGWQMVIGAAMLAVIGLVFEGIPSTTGAREVGLILLVAVVGNAVPFALFYVALGRGAAGKVSAWFFLVPVIGVLTAWPLLGEVPGPRLWAGLVLVCAGLWMVLAPPRR